MGESGTSASADDLMVYSVGLVFASVCVPAEMPEDEVVRQLNHARPTGLSHGWQIADEPFASGDPNPCACNRDPSRVHRLLNC